MKKVNLKRFSPGMWTAMGIQAVRTTGFSISFSYLPLYLHQQRHIAMTLVGLIILITGLISGDLMLLGSTGRQIRNRKTFIICQVIETMMFALLAVLMGIKRGGMVYLCDLNIGFDGRRDVGAGYFRNGDGRCTK